jgi:hypothetical protein
MRSKSLGLAIVLLAPSALAQTSPEEREPDRVQAPVTQSTDVQRPWLYIDDATIPAPWRVVGQLGETFSDNDRSVSRPFASGYDGPGAKANVTVQLGLPYHFALDVTGVLGMFGAGDSGACSPTSIASGSGLSGGNGATVGCSGMGFGMMAGARWAPFDGAKHGFRLSIGGGYLMDLDQSNGVYGRVTGTYETGRLRLAVMIHGEHVWRLDSDPVDLMGMVGASVRILPQFRLGLEYVAQDIEEAFDSGDDDDGPMAVIPGAAEGGTHQFVGLTGSLDLLHRRMFINFGPVLAFRPILPGEEQPTYPLVRPMARVMVSYTF